MGRRGGAVRGCGFTKHPAPSSSNLLLLAGCSVARDRALLRTLSCMLNTPAPCRILQPSALLCCRGGGEAALAFQHSSRRMAGGGKLQDRALLPWTLSCGSVSPPQSIPAHAQRVPSPRCCRSGAAGVELTHPAGMCSPQPRAAACLYFCSPVDGTVLGWGLWMLVA